MISLEGKWYDGKTSATQDVVCTIYDNGAYRIEGKGDGDPILTGSRFDIEISPRLANTHRYLLFPRGEKLETDDNDTVDRIGTRFAKSSWLNIVYILESHWRYVILALALLLLILWTVMSVGIPWVAKTIAYRLPPSVLRLAGNQTLDILDRSIFDPSELDANIREGLLIHFKPVIALHPGYGLEVVFRRGGKIGPNAFALPNGVIVFTDEIIQMAEHDDELSAVLAHEIGHIVHRHGMRTLIQDSILGFVLLAMTGDVSGSSELFLGLPVLLTELAYSRKFEREADEYALTTLRTHGISPVRFASLMRRIEKQKPGVSGGAAEKWIDYLSTHPLTEERLKNFERQ
ncbi:MAG: M48 family metallopeptidase [Deltaproteobacteria bacterium]|jgi:Zn-dependent protease with chaperone function|nr:M48 family metallopeptidase [Deltaproteobacteria bacterium]